MLRKYLVLLLCFLFISSSVYGLSLDDVSSGASSFFDSIRSFFRNFFGDDDCPGYTFKYSEDFCFDEKPDGNCCEICTRDAYQNSNGDWCTANIRDCRDTGAGGMCSGGVTTTTTGGGGRCTGYRNCYCVNPSTGGCCPPATCPVSGLDCHFDVDAGSCGYGQYMFCGYGGVAECRGAPNDCLDGCYESLGECQSGYIHEAWDISESECNSRASNQGKQAYYRSTSSYSCPNCDNPMLKMLSWIRTCRNNNTRANNNTCDIDYHRG